MTWRGRNYASGHSERSFNSTPECWFTSRFWKVIKFATSLSQNRLINSTKDTSNCQMSRQQNHLSCSLQLFPFKTWKPRSLHFNSLRRKAISTEYEKQWKPILIVLSTSPDRKKRLTCRTFHFSSVFIILPTFTPLGFAWCLLPNMFSCIDRRGGWLGVWWQTSFSPVQINLIFNQWPVPETSHHPPAALLKASLINSRLQTNFLFSTFLMAVTDGVAPLSCHKKGGKLQHSDECTLHKTELVWNDSHSEIAPCENYTTSFKVRSQCLL